MRRVLVAAAVLAFLTFPARSDVDLTLDAPSLTPGFDGPKQPRANKPMLDEDMGQWAAPFVMASINTRNVHRSNMLLGFPFGKDFVYDVLFLSGPG